uniref:Uncharacterized protein n=1 Tax=Brassica oleracea var. oleracea TaxID=109376 RepID=A0A0D2ZV22_BRAOL
MIRPFILQVLTPSRRIVFSPVAIIHCSIQSTSNKMFSPLASPRQRVSGVAQIK